MIELEGQPTELRFTLEIKRAATGATETVEMVGYIAPPQVLVEDKDDRNTQ